MNLENISIEITIIHSNTDDDLWGGPLSIHRQELKQALHLSIRRMPLALSVSYMFESENERERGLYPLVYFADGLSGWS